ncbi:MAG: FAD-dependent monooxygenase, partial [Steroidobacteraceae bacterium]
MSGSDCPVIIVGAGPVGLIAAACLARLGVRALVIDQNAGVVEGSRAVCLSRRTLEILDAIGAVAPFVRKGLGWTHGSAYAGAHLIHRLAMPHGPDDKHWPMTNLQQYYMEEFLLAHCAALGVEVRRNTTLVDAAQEQGVLLTVATAGGAQTLRADYLIAADGARSGVRHALGLALEGVSYAGRYLIADIRIQSDAPAERRVWFDPPSNRGSTIIMHKQPDDVWRMDYQLQHTDDEERELRAERVRERIQGHLDFIGERAQWQLLWHSIYRAHSLALDRYRHGRILFAGDAAHLVPIFGVRGLNSG